MKRASAHDTARTGTRSRHAQGCGVQVSHPVIPFADENTRLPAIVEPVKAPLGPDVLVWGATFFVKDARTGDYVRWHQDPTCGELDDGAEVTAWVALSTPT